MTQRCIVITGVSSGIGKSLVETLSRKGDCVIIGTVRKKEDARELKEQFGARFKSVVMDISKEEEVAQAADYILSMYSEIDFLINNAGIAVSGPIFHLPINDVKYQFEVNVFGLLQLTQQLLPAILKAQGRIINISSISGVFTPPFVGVYSASKHALEAMTDAMRRELLMENVKVILIQPATIRTAIWDKARGIDKAFAETPYAQFLNKADHILDKTIAKALEPQAVTRVVEKVMFAKNPKTRYLIHKRPLMFRIIAYFLPDKWVDALIKRKLFSGDDFRPV